MPSAVDVVKPALDHTVNQLFKPFRFGQWVRLAVTGILAGELSGAGGCGVQVPPMPPRREGSSQFIAQVGIPNVNFLFVLGIVLAIVLGLIFMVLMLYISSRMRFVLFDSIVRKECHIRAYWRGRGNEAFRYFAFQIALFLSMILGVFIVIGVPALIAFRLGWFRNPGQHLLPLILGGLILVLVFLTLVLGGALISVLTKDFVIPQMALEHISVGEAWRRLWSMIKAEKGGYAGYVGFKILLSIVAAVGMSVVVFAVILALLIPSGAVALIGFFLGRAIGLTWGPFTMALVIVSGSVALLTTICAVLLSLTPFIVFFPAYAIYFFSARYPALAGVVYPPPAGNPSG